MKKPKKSNTYTIDLHGQCYDSPSLEECAKSIESFLERNVSVYENTPDEVYPSPSYKIKVIFELEK